MSVTETINILDATSASPYVTKTTYKDVEVPTPRPGETSADFRNREAAFRAEIDAEEAKRKARHAARANRAKPVKPPFARVEKAARDFAKRRFRKSMTDGELREALARDGATVSVDDQDPAEVSVTVDASAWSVKFVVSREAIRGGRWRPVSARPNALRLANETDADGAVAWLSVARPGSN
jgi:hypothetical protein